MRTRLQEHEDFDTIDDNMNAVELLKLIKNVTYNFKTYEHPVLALRKSIFQFDRLHQGRTQSVQEYFDAFNNMVEVLEAVGANIGEYDTVINHHLETMNIKREEASADDLKEAKIEGRQRYLAMSFLMGSDRQRFAVLIENLHNDYLMGQDNYPESLTECFALLNHWSKKALQVNVGENTSTGVAFTNYGTADDDDNEDQDEVALNTNEDEKDDRPVKGRMCTRCGRRSHHVETCKANRHADGTLLLIVGSIEETEECNMVFSQTKDDGPNAQQDRNKSPVPRNWILLDNQSTVDVFCNPDLLENVSKSDHWLTIRCNAGVSKTNLRGRVRGYGEVWYDPNGIANILSMSNVKERFRVTYDSDRGNAFTVQGPDGRVHMFNQSERGLFFVDGEEFTKPEERDSEEGDVALVTTVAGNKSKYSNADYLKAKIARKLQVTMGRPETRDMIRMVQDKLIQNCPVEVADIRAAEHIFGPDVGSLKGKTTRRKPSHVPVMNANIPMQIMQQYKDVTICVDVMRVNKIPFFVSISRHIRFRTAERLADMSDKLKLKAIKNVCSNYRQRGFTVINMHADGEFESLRGDIAHLGINLNVVARDEHVPEAERCIRTIKERTRGTLNALPFRYMPPGMITELVYHSVYWLNAFPARGGIAAGYSPGYLVAGRNIDYDAHCKIEFGAYVQTHEEHDNSMDPRTVGAIALRPTGNVQGGFYFYSLNTGRRIARRAWTEIPMTDLVIAQVHRMARRANMRRELEFELDIGVPVAQVDNDEESDEESHDSNYDPSDSEDESDSDESNSDDGDDNDGDSGDEDDHESQTSDEDDDDDDADYVSESEDSADADDDDAEIAGVDDATNELENVSIPGVDDQNPVEMPGVADHDNQRNANEVETGDNGNNEMPVIVETPAEEQDPTGRDPQQELEDHANGIPGLHDAEDEEVVFDETWEDADNKREYGTMTMRSRTRRDYKQLHESGTTMVSIGEVKSVTSEGVAMVITDFEVDGDELKWEQCTYLCNDLAEGIALVTEQLSLKKGLALFRERGEDAVSGELKQVHDMRGFKPKQRGQMTEKEKHRALRYLMYLKEKRCGRIKARGCADGRKQRLWMDKNETSSPTVSIGALLLSCVIDAYEQRCVATCDIPGAFLQTTMDGEETVHILLEGKMAELLTKLDPSTYQKYTFKKNGVTQIYVELKKALYGTLKAALLFWTDLSKTLTEDGFEINPYDWCVANKTVNGKQCTVVWHVDDLKISHVEQAVVDDVIETLNKAYGKVSPVTVTRGTTHDYLGMNLVYKGDGTVDIDMTSYVQSVIDEAPECMDGIANTPAAEHLFTVAEEGTKLDTKTAEFFYHMVAKLLFICKRGRPDIQTAVAFLCTRVKSPDTDDYKKLGRVIKYLRKTAKLTLTLRADNMCQSQWWVDGSFAVHPDMRSHTGAYMSLGRGTLHGLSTKQKLNTKSSTEAELVAVDDTMGQMLWTQYFLGAQGYVMDASLLHQDNKSAMLLEKNGRGSSSKRTRHINVRYYFVTDRIKKGEVVVKYCPTGKMIADFFTKPLHGSTFTTLRDVIRARLMLPPTMRMRQEHRSVLEHRVVSRVMTQRLRGGRTNLDQSRKYPGSM